MSKKATLAVIFGRWQPLHNGHLTLFQEAVKSAKHVLVFVGSSNKPRTPQNPFSAEERIDMIYKVFESGLEDQVDGMYSVVPLPDSYMDSVWSTDVRRLVNEFACEIVADYGDEVIDKDVVVVGHEKDDTSYYLNIFPEWQVKKVPNFNGLNATDIRRELFDRKHPVDPGFANRVARYLKDWCGKTETEVQMFMDTRLRTNLPAQIDPKASEELSKQLRPLDLTYLSLNVPEGVREFLRGYLATESYLDMIEETFSYACNKMTWGLAPYAPTFVTVDAVVTMKGHVLLIRRKQSPGRGLWALPGGFIDQENPLVDNVIRELREETRISIPNNKLKDCITKMITVDDPYRSKRGRTITHAAHIDLDKLPDSDIQQLPTVRGCDDAEKARWFTFSEVLDFGSTLFEDHAEIIKRLVFSK